MIYTIRYNRDETGWWVATVKEVKGCHTQGKSIEQARKRIREALGLFVKDAAKAEFIEESTLTGEARTLVAEVKIARRRLAEQELEVRVVTESAVKRLTALGISRRDVGNLIGVSGQRVQQISAKRIAAKALSGGVRTSKKKVKKQKLD